MIKLPMVASLLQMYTIVRMNMLACAPLYMSNSNCIWFRYNTKLQAQNLFTHKFSAIELVCSMQNDNSVYTDTYMATPKNSCSAVETTTSACCSTIQYWSLGTWPLCSTLLPSLGSARSNESACSLINNYYLI